MSKTEKWRPKLSYTAPRVLKGLDILDILMFCRHFYKGDNFCDFLFTFLAHQVPSEKGSNLKGKKGSKFFPFRADPCLGKQNQFWHSGLPWKCIYSL